MEDSSVKFKDFERIAGTNKTLIKTVTKTKGEDTEDVY